MVQVHQDTVDTYLEDIILAAVDSTADEEARQEIQEQATKINDIAYELEETWVKGTDWKFGCSLDEIETKLYLQSQQQNLLGSIALF